MPEKCVCCGAVIPEGRQVCPDCERKARLRPCPFCGSDNVKFDWSMWSNVPLIVCKDCSAVVSFGANKRDSQKKSAELWNRRVNDG